MLRFNTFRSNRYLRSKFVEGKFLLASEATDLELELFDQLRKETQIKFGDVAIGDAWSIERLNATQILIKPGEAFFKGLPFSFREGTDQLVSGAVLSLGTVPIGVTATDDAAGLGKIITFNNAAITPTNIYKVVVTATEEIITEVEDPFLQNSNLTETTSQKVRILYQINLVPNSLQTETPIPYRDENSTSGSVTNFPSDGAFSSPNLVNQTTVTPTASGNGELISLNLISGSEGIDGRDVEITLRNDSGIGSGIVLPNSPITQQFYYNGKLIDSNGSIYHINAIFNDTVSTQVVLRIDKEPDQPNPQIVNTKPFTIVKRDVYVTDDSNGLPQGKLHWPIATIDFNTSSGVVHQSKITDLRNKIEQIFFNQKALNSKVDVVPLNSGDLSWTLSTNTLNASDVTKLFNGHDTADYLSDVGYILKDNSCAAFTLKYDGSTLNKGNLSITINSVISNTATLASVDLSSVELGNLVEDSAGNLFYITAIDDVNNTITLDSAPATGSAAVILDSYQEGYVKNDSSTYIFAVRYSNKVYVANLELEDGETSQIGDGISQQLLTFIGATGEADSSPSYSSNNYVTNGDSLVTAIGELDTGLNAHVTNPTGAHAASAISNIPSGDLTSTNVQDALNELQTDTDTRATRELDNLQNTAVNADIKPDSLSTANSRNLGSPTLPWNTTRTMRVAPEDVVYTITGDVSTVSNQITNIVGTLPALNQGYYYFAYSSNFLNNYDVITNFNSSTVITLNTNPISNGIGITIKIVAFVALITDAATGTDPSGGIVDKTGNTVNGDSGPISSNTGNVSGTGKSGSIQKYTGDSTGGDSGDLTLGTGQAAGTRGKIYLDAREIDFLSKHPVNVPDPINYTDGSNKEYVDYNGGLQIVATAGGTTTLVSTNPRFTLYTGTLAQTVNLPSTATLVLGNTWTFINRSTGDVTVKNSTGSTLGILAPNQIGVFKVSNTVLENWVSYVNFVTSVLNSTIANNQSSVASVTNLLIDGTRFRSFTVDYWVYRTSTTDEVAESGTIVGVYKTTAGTWQISIGNIAGDAGVDFFITTGGQVQYTSDNQAGSSYAGNMRWQITNLLRI